MSSELSLFTLSVEAVCDNFLSYRQHFHLISANTLSQIYYDMVTRGEQERLQIESELRVFTNFIKLLGSSQRRHELHFMFQVINNDILSTSLSKSKPFFADEEDGPLVQNIQNQIIPTRSASLLLGATLEKAYLNETKINLDCELPSNRRWVLFKHGMLLGEFLCDAGWFHESALVLRQCLFVCLSQKCTESFKNGLRCLERLLSSQTQYNMINETKKTYKSANVLIETLEKTPGVEINLAKIFSVFSNYHFNENRYNDALKHSLDALRKLDGIEDTRVIIDVLRQTAKCCSFKREFAKAELLITQAVCLAREFYGCESVKYADALFDYGYFLINSDSVRGAVKVYMEVLEIRKQAFGLYNLNTAIALEELAYALYVQEYSTGLFASARKYSDEALSVMTVLLPNDHLQLASAKRVKALILEEIAIESAGTPLEEQLLLEAESLHLFCLQLTTNVFGVMNVQTAKHFGNLGRLYQTMKKYQDAELMHLKAISIKERLLGKLDYEVALSVGHLASLYNYDMHQYDKAEMLHLRSIEIGRKLFGDSYSGLEYDYRGLLQVYNMEGNLTKHAEYSAILNQWRLLQELKRADSTTEQPTRRINKSPQPIVQIVQQFFDLEWKRYVEDEEIVAQSSSPSPITIE